MPNQSQVGESPVSLEEFLVTSVRLMKDVVRSDLDAWAAKGVAVGDLIFIVSDGQFPGIEEGCFVTLFSGVRPLCEARIGRGLRNMEVKDFCKDPCSRPAWRWPMRNYSLGWAENRRRAADRRRFRCHLAAQIFGLFLSGVCLWAVWSIGWDFVEYMPSADMGAW